MVSEILVLVIIKEAVAVVLTVVKAFSGQKDYVERLIDSNQSIAINQEYSK